MMRKAAARALWSAKGAALFWGLALTLAVVLGRQPRREEGNRDRPLRTGVLGRARARTQRRRGGK